MIHVTVQLLSFGRSYECEIPLDAKVRIVITKLVEKLNVPAITMAAHYLVGSVQQAS